MHESTIAVPVEEPQQPDGLARSPNGANRRDIQRSKHPATLPATPIFVSANPAQRVESATIDDGKITTFLRWVGALRHAQLSGRQRLLLLTVFIIATVFAVRDFPLDSIDQIRPLALLASFALVFVTIFLSAAAYRAQGIILGYKLGWSEAFRTQVVASTANLLPLPGAVLVRTGALVDLGSSAGAAVSTTTISGLAWLGVSGVVAGPAFVVSGQLPIGAALTLGSLVLIAISWGWTARLAVGSAVHAWLQLMLPTVGLVLVFGTRYLLLIIGLGVDASLGQTLSLVIVGALASAVGFFPSGLGMREALAAAAATLVDLPASVGYVVAAVDDLALLLVIGILGLVFLRRDRPTYAAADEP